VTAFLAAQYAGTLDLLDSTRVDARVTQPLPTAPTPPPREVVLAADLSTVPTARLHLSDRRWDYALTYSPSISFTDVELGTEGQAVISNAGTASIGWHDRFVRLTLFESASYALENLAYLYTATGQGLAAGGGQTQSMMPGSTTGPTMTVPGQGTTTTPGQPTTAGASATGTSGTLLKLFPYGSSYTNASMAVRASRQVTFSLSGGYSVAGNLSKEGAVALPVQFGPLGSATLAYAVSRVDSLLTVANAQQTTTPLGACIPPILDHFCRQVEPIIQVQEVLRHQLSATATLTAGVGAAASVEQLATSVQQLSSEEAWVILPTGVIGLVDRLGGLDDRNASFVTFSGQLAPVVDVNLGELSNRIQGTALLTRPVANNVFLSVTLGVVQSIPPDPSPLTGLNGGIDLRYRVNRQIDVACGLQAFWQRQAIYGAAPAVGTATNEGFAVTAIPTTTASEIAYVTLTARLPTLHF
jgi:hypothetical protein